MNKNWIVCLFVLSAKWIAWANVRRQVSGKYHHGKGPVGPPPPSAVNHQPLSGLNITRQPNDKSQRKNVLTSTESYIKNKKRNFMKRSRSSSRWNRLSKLLTVIIWVTIHCCNLDGRQNVLWKTETRHVRQFDWFRSSKSKGHTQCWHLLGSHLGLACCCCKQAGRTIEYKKEAPSESVH